MYHPEPSVPNGSVVTIKNEAGNEITVYEAQLVANSDYFKWQFGLIRPNSKEILLEVESEFATKASLATFKYWLDHGFAGPSLDDHGDRGEERLLNRLLNLVDCFLLGQAILASNFQKFVLYTIRDTCAIKNDDGCLCDVIPKVWEHIPTDSGSVLRELLYEKSYEILGELDPTDMAEALKAYEEPFRSEVTQFILDKMNGK
ncbi:uncharacterized protein F4807DRAFT_456571 [Annulohypoxylon truncatum]|uniref:uncharacterized protein n=1 Tax=Annulohypoxylon truncatum TaxID=327061 RepID=UPI00200874F1|nr:uncharacterized protein F4807DRAFT_456571 [Annulohypoxylon truncatum]KAI1213230.1 hypothetical protein F4807DRAFT_456571 [Annulohypoxylon truncatum]